MGRSVACVTSWQKWLLLAAALLAFQANADEMGDIGQLLRDGKLTEAQTRVDKQLQAKPRDAQLRFFKGVIQRESGRLGDATATFSKLSEDHPDLPEPYNNLAVIYAAQGQYDKARLSLEKALRTNPAYATAHENLGDIYARLSSQAYSKALQIDGAAAANAAPTRLALIRELSTAPGAQLHPLLAAAAKPAAPVIPTPPKPLAAASPPRTPSTPAAANAATTKPPVPQPPVITPPTATPSNRAVEQAVQVWAQAWASKNMAQYLAAYSKDFQIPGNVARRAWEEDRRLRIMGKSRISVNLTELQITVTGERAVAKFRQDYKADALAVQSRKTLELVHSGERWLIVKESSGG